MILKEYCNKVGIIYLFTPFSYQAAKELMTIGLEGFKIGSGEMTDLTSLRAIAALGNPMILSTGKFIGNFNEMYEDFDDPWEQSTKKEWASDKAVVLNLISKLKVRKVIELGCGLGHFTNRTKKSIEPAHGIIPD